MEIKALLDKANEGYSDGFLSQYYDDKGKKKKGSGDTLAEFIVIEIIETFEGKATDSLQIQLVTRILESAIKDLQNVIDVLNK